MHFDAITYSLLKDRKLINVAPLCTVETSGWTGSQSGEVLFTGDGTTVDFSGKVELPPVNPLNSFVLHYTIGGTTYDATADSDGNITGEHITSGTINQDGTYEIHFDTAPDDGTDGTADYNHGIAPANLENALDPNNPNPSDWGWNSRTGSGPIGKITLYPRDAGFYLINVIYEVNFITSAVNLGLVLETEGTVKKWVGNLREYTGYEDIVVSDTGGFFIDKDILTGFKLNWFANSATEVKIRVHRIIVAKLL